MGQREPAASPDGDPDVASSDETTLAEGDWPVAPQYQVTPDQPLEDQRQGERATVAVGPPRGTWLRHPPRAAVLATVLALVLLLGAAAAWIAVGLDEPTGTGSAAPPSPSAGASEPSTPPPSSGTTAPTASTETDTDTGTTTAEPTARVSVPGVVGLPASVAARRVRAADLRPETRVVTSSSPTGTVVGQDPSPGTELERGDAVVLRVARQPRPTTVQMPRLEGLAASAAKNRLRTLGLHWTVVETASDEVAGTVVGQTPSARATVRKGSTVTLRVSSGPASVTVPDVTGLDEAAARAQLEDAGFDVNVLNQPTTDPAEDGMVVIQDPAGGADAEKGSVVTITVARLS